MPTREEALAERTYKEDGLEAEKRIFYTLHGEGKSPQRDELQNHRNRFLTEEQLDEILLEVTY